MTINELANVQRANIDNITGEEISHSEKWGRVVNALGYEAVKHCIPFTLEQVKNALRTDKHMNNLAIRIWDSAAGFTGCQTGRAMLMPSPFTGILRKAGVKSFSPSDCVCILKEAARMWAEEA